MEDNGGSLSGSLNMYEVILKSDENKKPDEQNKMARSLIKCISEEVTGQQPYDMRRSPFLVEAYDFYCGTSNNGTTSAPTCEITLWDAQIISQALVHKLSGNDNELEKYLQRMVRYLFTEKQDSFSKSGTQSALEKLKTTIDELNQPVKNPPPLESNAPQANSPSYWVPPLTAFSPQYSYNPQIEDMKNAINAISGALNQVQTNISKMTEQVSNQEKSLTQLANQLKSLEQIPSQMANWEKRLEEYGQKISQLSTATETASTDEQVPALTGKWNERLDQLWKELQVNQPLLSQALKGMIEFQGKLTKEYILRFAELMNDLYHMSFTHYSYYKENKNAEPSYTKIADNYKDYYEQIKDALAEFGFEIINPRVGDSFNAIEQEAVKNTSSSGHHPPIREISQTGIRYQGKVIKKAQVKV